MMMWGDAAILWSDAVREFVLWRRNRRRTAQAVERLCVEAEAFLAGAGPVHPT